MSDKPNGVGNLYIRCPYLRPKYNTTLEERQEETRRRVEEKEDIAEIEKNLQTPLCRYCRVNEATVVRRTGAVRPCKKCRTKAINLYKYGLSLDKFWSMYHEQHGRCTICAEEFGEKGAVVDHCHEFGHVRGLLCYGCNSMIGLAHDDTSVLKRAIRYLDNNITERSWFARPTLIV